MKYIYVCIIFIYLFLNLLFNQFGNTVIKTYDIYFSTRCEKYYTFNPEL